MLPQHAHRAPHKHAAHAAWQARTAAAGGGGGRRGRCLALAARHVWFLWEASALRIPSKRMGGNTFLSQQIRSRRRPGRTSLAPAFPARPSPHLLTARSHSSTHSPCTAAPTTPIASRAAAEARPVRSASTALPGWGGTKWCCCHHRQPCGGQGCVCGLANENEMSLRPWWVV